MADAQSALWPASFKGVSFWVEHDSEHGGRRLIVHEFPRRDLPFIEDLGQHAKSFQITAYLVGDASAGAARGFASVCDATGAGLLVLPTHGPVLVRCMSFSRERGKDRIGYIAFSAVFFREGAASSLASAPQLAQLAFNAVGALAVAARGIASGLSLAGAPAWVVASAVASVQDGVASLESLRADRGVDPALAGDLALSLSALYAEVADGLTPLAIDTTFVDDLFAAAQALAEAMDPFVASGAFSAELAGFPASVDPAGVSANSARAASNATAINQLSRLALMSGWVDGLLRATFTDRPTAVSARSDVFAALDVELEAASARRDADVYSALGDLRASLSQFFAGTVADLRPVVIVSAPRMLPAVWHAWRLYGDPTMDISARAQELIDRNRAPHPAFLSERFEALAP